MEHRLFDHTGSEVSEIGLGTWQLGGSTESRVAIEVCHGLNVKAQSVEEKSGN